MSAVNTPGTPSMVSVASTVDTVFTTDRAGLAAARASLPGPVVLVPTMGALHAGHRALLRRASALAGPDGSVVVSVFVNPLQFAPGEDLDSYPRTPDEDMAICREHGVAVVFAPGPAQMYTRAPVVTIDPGPPGGRLEGEFRPGFFRGVLTVVLKLLMLTRPDVTVFGEKDAQQLALVREMVTDLDLGVEIAAVPTVRDADGLAVSSRNRHLSPAERATALSLWRGLAAARDEAACGSARAIAAARAVLDEAAAGDPPLRLDYIALADPRTFAPVGDPHVGAAVLAVAGRVGITRLIDNVALTFAPTAEPTPATDPAHRAEPPHPAADRVRRADPARAAGPAPTADPAPAADPARAAGPAPTADPAPAADPARPPDPARRADAAPAADPVPPVGSR